MKRNHAGQIWEKKAESFLRKRGLTTLERNFHSRFGEIDLVMKDRQHLVFVEVRYRKRSFTGSGAETVDAGKMRRIEQTARFYLSRHARHAVKPCRFDVISISGKEGETQIEWIRDAFEAARG